MCGFCNVRMCVFVRFLMCVCMYVALLMCRCVYLWVL